RAPGRMSDPGWAERNHRLITSLGRRLRSAAPGALDFQEEVLFMLEPLVAAYAMPFFQADYELVVRGWHFRDWGSTRELTDGHTLTGILRALTDDPQSMQARVVVPRPCSFVSLGFLDGGTYRTLRERREPDLERFLSRTQPTRIRWADVMWVGPLAWLDE